MNAQANSAEIDSLSHEGRGISHQDGKTIFIEGALPGEKVTFNYLRRHGDFDEARVLEILTPSPLRVMPQCPHFGVCGGCSLQHLIPEAQRELKQRTLLEQLKHFGKVTPETILPPLFSENYGYRHKARLSVKYVKAKNKVLVGFHEKKGRFVADLNQCPILHPIFGEKISLFGELISSLSIFQKIPQLEVAMEKNGGALVFRILEKLSMEDEEKLIDFSKRYNYQIFLQPGDLSSTYPLEGNNSFLSYLLPKYSLELFFHPQDFTQINYQINLQMIDLALDLLELSSKDRVLDLFCGMGNFSLPIATRAGKVIGIEGSNNLISLAQKNAAFNKVDTTFYRTDLYSENEIDNSAWAKEKFTKILLDPPRTGALEIVSRFKKFKAQTIVYVSCNPATLARDAEILVQQGYRLKKAGIIDMFPHTKHTEAIAQFVWLLS
jgi:23S rRNA (uracil1939-C5)-methyltransferase